MIADIPDFLRRLPDDQRTPCYGQGRLFTSDAPVDQALAAALCAGCPVRTGCADHATTRGEPTGIWGGLSRASSEQEEHGLARERARGEGERSRDEDVREGAAGVIHAVGERLLG